MPKSHSFAESWKCHCTATAMCVFGADDDGGGDDDGGCQRRIDIKFRAQKRGTDLLPIVTGSEYDSFKLEIISGVSNASIES